MALKDNAKKLNEEETEKVNGGLGERLHIDTIRNVTKGTHLIYQDTYDSCENHDVIFDRVEGDYVYIYPGNDQEAVWFKNNCRHISGYTYYGSEFGSLPDYDGSSDIKCVDSWSGNWNFHLYQIYYTKWSTTYFYMP